ncbi:DUF2911 domain-containing protein [Sphingobacterium spiritivorum]|uniref:DUF2911 domain-containing protein n=1 Tax=Sphingobacterium spiritivorum TaxID=258 RepID=UPI003DA51B39
MKTQAILLFFVLLSATAFGQTDKSKRPSPPDSVRITTDDGVTIAVNYSRPSLKGRQIGVDVAPIGKVWRTGANEATTFEINKDVSIEGQELPAGKYSLYSIPGEQQITLIFNKTWNQWGTKYEQSEDALRVDVTPTAADTTQEQFKISADKSGKVQLIWGEHAVPFTVKAVK